MMMFFRNKAESSRNAPAQPIALPAAANDAVAAATPPAMGEAPAARLARPPKQPATVLGEIVALLMRSPNERFCSLQDLEWLVLPALQNGQFALAEAKAKKSGTVGPVGVVLWARVSAEVDQRLASSGAAPLRLTPDEWRSGHIPWIVVASGEKKIVNALLAQLTRETFKGNAPKMRLKGKDGKGVVGRLEVDDKRHVSS
jgi:hemolysin-activating ACP:hemolysin acyltransferase